MAEVGGRLTERWLPRGAVGEALALWAVGFGSILVAFLVSPPAATVVATLGFLYLPVLSMDRRGEEAADYGLSTRRLGQDLRDAVAVGSVVFPLFVLGYLAFTWLLPLVPAAWLRVLTPYLALPHFAPRLPDRFGVWAVHQLFVVALPEEFFYRGFLQGRLRDAWPGGRLFLGARLGPAFWLTAALFAVGHLAIFQAWRLAVFFPALLFGWMRERSGSVVGAALIHAGSNLLLQVLDASFFGR